jgi:hypothetical protein
MEEREKPLFIALSIYWCLHMLIQQVLSIEALFIEYKLEKLASFTT